MVNRQQSAKGQRLATYEQPTVQLQRELINRTAAHIAGVPWQHQQQLYSGASVHAPALCHMVSLIRAAHGAPPNEQIQAEPGSVGSQAQEADII